MWDSSGHNQSISDPSATERAKARTSRQQLTRFAGLVLSFSKSFCDCDLEALITAKI